MKAILPMLLLLTIISCDSEDELSCSSQLGGCNTNGRFCTFGFKWGEPGKFAPSGNNISGPETSGGTVSFSFMNAGHVIRTHSETNVTTRSFESHQIHCAKQEIRNALSEFSSIADINFEEDTTEQGDIRFYAADLQVTAVAFPKLSDPACADLSGQVVFNSRTILCHEYFLLALHEIGHALGLGHVTTSNIMKEGAPNLSFDGLQSGDIEGVQSIYGSR